MSDQGILSGLAAPLPLENLDTDQIMPKQFLRGIDKAGLDKGLLYDLRFDGLGRPRPDFILDRPGYAESDMLIAGANFGCGSSREHAVWGLMQFGIRAIIAPSFGEIFYFNALNNGLVLVTLEPAAVQALMERSTASGRSLPVDIDLHAQRLSAQDMQYPFTMAARHRDMFLQGTDLTGSTLARLPEIEAFAHTYWERFPWNRNVAHVAREYLAAQRAASPAA